MGLLAVVLHPDTGHVPRYGVPVMLGIPGFILGLLASAAFSCLANAVHETYTTRLGERMLLGGAIGAIAGQLIVWVFLTGSAYIRRDGNNRGFACSGLWLAPIF
jgi:hypothetical protein